MRVGGDLRTESAIVLRFRVWRWAVERNCEFENEVWAFQLNFPADEAVK